MEWNGRNVCKGSCGHAWPCKGGGNGFNGYWKMGMKGTWCREMGMVSMRIKNGVRWTKCGLMDIRKIYIYIYI